jgi:2-haloacid dehalogenase
MVAAHSYDLVAAAAAGLRTAFIARPNEHGHGKGERSPSVPVAFAAVDVDDLADQLGCA